MEPVSYTLVTGASSGIGRETAIQLSSSRNLVLHGRDGSRLEETRKACAHPDRHALWPMDLGNLAGIENGLHDCLRKQNMVIEALVHCAGTLKIQPMRMMKLEVTQEIMNVNFFSAAEIIRLLLKKSINHDRLEAIVFVSSTASQFGARGFNLYCASKGALDSLMRALAVELAPKIRINSVLPGGIRTGMTESMFGDSTEEERIKSAYPLGLGKTTDIAAAIEFLLSEKARWITGQQLVVDGGQTINITA